MCAHATVHVKAIAEELPWWQYGLLYSYLTFSIPSSLAFDVAFLPINLPLCVFTERKVNPFVLTITDNQTESVTLSKLYVLFGKGDAYIFKKTPYRVSMAPRTSVLTFYIKEGTLTFPQNYPKVHNYDWIFDKNTGYVRGDNEVRVQYNNSRQIKIWFNLTSNNSEYNSIDYYFYDSKTKTYLHDFPKSPDRRRLDETGAFIILISPDFKGEIAFEGKRYIIDKTKAENQLIVKED